MIEVIRAAWVIGRRDFTAIIMSKAFFFFLLGPVFPIAVGVAAGMISGQVAQDIGRPVIGLALSPADNAAMVAARGKLAEPLGGRLPELRMVSSGSRDPAALLADKREKLAAVLTGTLAAPRLAGKADQIAEWQGEVALLAAQARDPAALRLAPVALDAVAQSQGSAKQTRLLTAQAGQGLLFFLTMLLAGMVLSNLVEEKANKIIEVLAAAIPIDAVFLGKLFAMLAMAFVGIIVWTTLAVGILLAASGGAIDMPAPAVGWPLFAVLAVVYFTMAYLLLGSLFLGIGAMAATVREVQTLSMPVTMLQLIVFFFAMSTVTKLDQPIEKAAAIFPFSSPFAMIARAAQSPDLLPHLVAIIGQGLFAVLVLRVGVYLFRRNVMKSGRGGRRKARVAAAG